MCAKHCVIANKKYWLCYSCNQKRLGHHGAKTALKSRVSLRGGSLKKKAMNPTPRKPTGEREMFEEIWEERPHYCEHCGAYLGEEPRAFYFAHVRGKGAHPELRLVKENVRLWCMACHHAHDFGGKEEFERRKKR